MSQERNAKCACGSGLKYKKCCLLVERENARLAMLEWKENMRKRAEARRVERERMNDYLRANPGALDRRRINPWLTAVTLAAIGSRNL
jgi:hypothetical protein